jgi:hypothetical protein
VHPYVKPTPIQVKQLLDELHAKYSTGISPTIT